MRRTTAPSSARHRPQRPVGPRPKPRIPARTLVKVPSPIGAHLPWPPSPVALESASRCLGGLLSARPGNCTTAMSRCQVHARIHSSRAVSRFPAVRCATGSLKARELYTPGSGPSRHPPKLVFRPCHRSYRIPENPVITRKPIGATPPRNESSRPCPINAQTASSQVPASGSSIAATPNRAPKNDAP